MIVLSTMYQDVSSPCINSLAVGVQLEAVSLITKKEILLRY